MEIKIKYHTDIEPIKKLPNGDWYDLSSAENVELEVGDFKLISLGISMKLPECYEAHVAPRSSTFKTWGIIQTNGVGVIDESYCGENDIWKMPVYATRKTTIKKGDRVCQFRILKKQPNYDFKVVEFMENDDRNGFGSTGIN